MGAPIARVKSKFRRLSLRQFRHALAHQTGKSRGRVHFSQIARMLEISLDAWDGAKAEELHKSVGYFINEEGYMDWDLLRILDPTTVSASAAVGADVTVDDEVGSSRSGWREAQDENRAATEAAIARAAVEIEAAHRAIDTIDAPPVETPTLVVPRSHPKSKNQFGCCLTSGDHLRELQAVKEAEVENNRVKENRATAFWEGWREKAKAAEGKLQAEGTPTKLKVGEMKALIVSRTGHLPKAKNNLSPLKPMLSETRAAIGSVSISVCPPTPPPRLTPPPSATDGTVADEGEAEGAVICPSCGRVDPDVYLDDGKAFCTCEARVHALDVVTAIDQAPGDEDEE